MRKLFPYKILNYCQIVSCLGPRKKSNVGGGVETHFNRHFHPDGNSEDIEMTGLSLPDAIAGMRNNLGKSIY
jgi:hypothetical protein